jgi:hypothetical protein
MYSVSISTPMAGFTAPFGPSTLLLILACVVQAKENTKTSLGIYFAGSDGRIRTCGQLINSQLLYR